jgi:hypothetical protein
MTFVDPIRMLRRAQSSGRCVLYEDKIVSSGELAGHNASLLRNFRLANLSFLLGLTDLHKIRLIKMPNFLVAGGLASWMSSHNVVQPSRKGDVAIRRGPGNDLPPILLVAADVRLNEGHLGNLWATPNVPHRPRFSLHARECGREFVRLRPNAVGRLPSTTAADVSNRSVDGNLFGGRLEHGVWDRGSASR